MTAPPPNSGSEPYTPTLWDNIKNNASPRVYLSEKFEAPQRLVNVSTLAWEDSMFISDDGLHLFSFYAPFSLFLFQTYVKNYPYTAPNVCAPIQDYIRGSILSGSDFELGPPYDLPDSICKHGNGIIHSEIAYASRASVNDDFSNWSRHAVSKQYYYESGFSASDNGDGTYNLVFAQSTDSNQSDIMWVQNAPNLTPASATPISISANINTNMQEDNPHLERVSPTELILLMDNHHEVGGSGDTKIKYSISLDNGSSWSTPMAITSGTINISDEDLTGHLFKDSLNNWWLYFVSNRDGAVEIWRIKHTNNNLISDFDNWNASTLEKVIGIGNINGGYGTIEGVGEPSLTSNGDLYFVVVYCKNIADKTDFDGCDIDPWIAKKK